MQSRGSSNRLPALALRSRISSLVLAMLTTMASLYVAGRLWQDAGHRVYLIKELNRTTGDGGEGHSVVSVADSLRLVACRDQREELSALETQLAAARQAGFVAKFSSDIAGTRSRKRLLAVIGIATGFDRKRNRDEVRKSWLSTGAALKKLDDKGIIVRFVIGRSANPGDSLHMAFDDENKHTKDFPHSASHE